MKKVGQNPSNPMEAVRASVPDTEVIVASDIPGTVVNCDGKEVETKDAKVLNYHLLEDLSRLNPQMKGVLKGLMQAIKDKGPGYYSFSPEDAESHKLFVALAKLRQPRDTAVTVSYSEALKGWMKGKAMEEERKAQKEEAEKPKEAPPSEPTKTSDTPAVVALDPVTAARAKAKKQVSDKLELDEALSQLIPDSVVLGQKEKAKNRQAEIEVQKEKDKADEKMGKKVEEMAQVLIEGRGCVDNNARPTKILGEDKRSFHIVDFRDFDDQLRDGTKPENVKVQCSFCEAKLTLGQTKLLWDWREGKDVEMFMAVQLNFVVLDASGKRIFQEMREGLMKGTPRKQGVCACLRCAEFIRGIAPRDEADPKNPGKMRPSMYYTDIFPRFAVHVEKQMAKGGIGVSYHSEAPELKSDTLGDSVKADPAKKEEIDELLESLPVDRPEPAIAKFDKRQAKTAKRQAAMVAAEILGSTDKGE